MPVKVLLIYKLSTGGAKSPSATESWMYLGAAASLVDPALHTACENFMNARTELCGNNVLAVGYRVSFPGIRRKSKRVLSGTTAGAGLNRVPVTSQGSSDIANSALQVECYSAALQKANRYLAGLPDAFITTAGAGGPDFSAVGLSGYQAKWDAWHAIATGGLWGFKALADLPPAQPFEITSWSNQTDAPFELILGLPGDQGIWDVNDVVHVRGVLMFDEQHSAPVGRWRIRSVSQTATETFYTLRGSGAFDSSLIEQPGTIESVGYEYVPFVSVDPANQTSRRRGIGPLRPRGRSRGRRRRQAY
jgi:hypothetical protein